MIFRSLWLRPTLAHPLRTMMTVLGVAIGVASVVSTLLASRAAVASMGSDVETIAGQARLEITSTGDVNLDELSQLSELSDQVLLAPVVEESVLCKDLGDLVRLLGVDLRIDSGVRLVKLDVGEGDLQTAVSKLLFARSAAIATPLADRLGLRVGDQLSLVIQARAVELEIAALFEPERFASAWDRVVIVNIGLAQDLLDSEGRLDRLELVPRTEWDETAFLERVRELLPAGYQVAPSSVRRQEGERMVRALEFNLTALSGVSLLVGIVLVATALATSVVQRRAQIALLRSLGASQSQLARALLLEAGTIGLLGGALGVMLGWLGATNAVAGVHATVASISKGVIPGQVEFNLAWAAFGVGLGVVVSMIAAMLPMREALQTPPLQGLRGVHPESVARRPWKQRAFAFALLVGAGVFFAQLPPLSDRPIWALISTLCILSTLLVLAGPLVDLFASIPLGFLKSRAAITLRLAQASLEAGRRRSAWAAGAVGVAVGLAVSMTIMVGSFRKSVVDWTVQAMPSDLFVRPLATDAGALVGRLDSEVVRIARDVFGATNVDPFYESKAYHRGDAVILDGAELSVVAREGGVPFLDGRPSGTVFQETVDKGGIVVNEPFARRFDVERGDSIQLDVPGGPIQRDIVGVYRDYSGHTGRVVMNLEDYFSHYPDRGAESISVYVDEDVNVDAARDDFAAALGGRFAIQVLKNSEVREEVLRVFDRTFAVTIAMQFISSLVAAIAVVTVLTALVHERRRELAVLRVLGGSNLQLLGLVLSEALLLGLAGTLGGLLVGLVVGYLLVTVVNVQSFGWTLQFVTPNTLYLTLLGVLPACVVAGLIPAYVSLRATPKESIQLGN